MMKGGPCTGMYSAARGHLEGQALEVAEEEVASWGRELRHVLHAKGMSMPQDVLSELGLG